MDYYYLRGTKNKHECNLLQIKSSSQSCGIILMSKKNSKYRTPLFEYGYHRKETKDVSESNFYALFKGLEHALENDIYDLMIESDSIFLIKSIVSKRSLSKPYYEYIEKIKMYISIFNTIGIRYIHPKRNDEAENLAEIAFTYKKNFETKYFE